MKERQQKLSQRSMLLLDDVGAQDLGETMCT
jgi:hypothetical protein